MIVLALGQSEETYLNLQFLADLADFLNLEFLESLNLEFYNLLVQFKIVDIFGIWI